MTAASPPVKSQLTLDLPGGESNGVRLAVRVMRVKAPLPSYPSPEVRINWFTVFSQLKDAKWSMYRIESQLKIPKTTLMGWKDGAEPKHYDGERLIQLWCDITSLTRDQLPVERRMLSAFQSRR